MPSERLHRRVALDSERTSQQLLDISPTWATVAAFYAALHWVDAFLARESNLHPENHPSRGQVVERTSGLRRIYVQYQRLFVVSLQARYQGISFSREEASKLIAEDLAAIKAVVISAIGT